MALIHQNLDHNVPLQLTYILHRKILIHILEEGHQVAKRGGSGNVIVVRRGGGGGLDRRVRGDEVRVPLESYLVKRERKKEKEAKRKGKKRKQEMRSRVCVRVSISRQSFSNVSSPELA